MQPGGLANGEVVNALVAALSVDVDTASELFDHDPADFTGLLGQIRNLLVPSSIREEVVANNLLGPW